MVINYKGVIIMSSEKNKNNKTTNESVVSEINTRNNHSRFTAEPSMKSSTDSISQSIFTNPKPQKNNQKDD